MSNLNSLFCLFVCVCFFVSNLDLKFVNINLIIEMKQMKTSETLWKWTSFQSEKEENKTKVEQNVSWCASYSVNSFCFFFFFLIIGYLSEFDFVFFFFSFHLIATSISGQNNTQMQANWWKSCFTWYFFFFLVTELHSHCCFKLSFHLVMNKIFLHTSSLYTKRKHFACWSTFIHV